MDRLNKVTFTLDKVAEWSIYLIILCLPFSKSIVEICIVTAILGLVLKKILAGEPILSENTGINIFLYLFLGATLLSFINTAYLALSLRAFFSKSLKFAALFLITNEIINTKTKLKNFIIIATLSCVIVLSDGFIQYFITHVDLLHNYTAFKFVITTPQFPGFPTASFPFPNDLAGWILMFISPFLIFTFLGKGRWQVTLFTGVISAALLYLFTLAKVRGAWMAFLISFVFLTFMKLKKIGIILLIVVVLSGLFINRALISDITSMTSIADRSVMWKYSVQIFKQHPIIGNGLNTFYVNYMNIREDKYRYAHGSYAHNCYLQTAADIGLVGLILFIAFVTAVLVKSFRSAAAAKDPFYYSLILGISFGLAALLIHSAVDTDLYSLPLAVLFWLSLGLLLATSKIAEASR